MYMTNKRRRLIQFAGRQHNVVSLAELYRLGFSWDDIRTMIRQGLLHRIHEGVYAVGPPNLTVKGHLTAAKLAAGPQAFFSDYTGAAIRGLRSINTRRIEMTLPVGHTPPRRTSLIFHRTTTPIDALEVGWCDGFRVSTVPRLLVELAGRRAGAGTLKQLLTEAVRTDTFDPNALEQMLGRHPRMPGVAMLKEVADYYRPLPDRKSELERMFQRDHARHPEIPPCDRNVMIGKWEVDCWWPDHRLALELDGRRYHAAQADFEKDRYKDTQLQLMVIRPMRISYWMWKDDCELQIANIAAMLALPALTV